MKLLILFICAVAVNAVNAAPLSLRPPVSGAKPL